MSVIVKCKYKCGKTNDMSMQARIHARLGFRGKPSWICAECFKREYPKMMAEEEARKAAQRKLRQAGL